MDLQTAQRLYEYRKSNGYSQEELAEKIGVSRQAISKWERSESSPDTDNLIALARLYGVTIDELINGNSAPAKAEESEPAEEAEAPVEEQEEPQAAGDNVDISLKNGINVSSSDGDRVHIGFDGIKVSEGNSQEFNNNILKHAKKTSPLFDAIVACAGLLLFILTGAFTPGGWAYSWLFLIMIPVIITAGEAFRSKNPSKFCYPLLIVVLYCGLGLCAHIWHPTWILWITIPIYYILCDAYKKSKAPAAGEAANGTYYTPGTANAQTSSAYAQEQGRSGKTVTVILGVLIGVLLAAVIGSFALAAVFSFNNDNIISTEDKSYSTGSGEVAADSINSIDIDWVNGKVTVAYYDGETVSFTEEEQTDPDYRLRYKLDDDGELEIEFCKDTIAKDISGFNVNRLSKDLTVYIPQGMALSKLDIDDVSAEVSIDAITANVLKIDTVSGGITAAGVFNSVNIDSVSATASIAADSTLAKLRADSVSADITLYLPADIPGFKIKTDSVSGRVDTFDFTSRGAAKISDGTVTYGDGSLDIDFDTVSGSLVIKAVTAEK